MKYPTMEEVERADREQLARWFRFLESPGMSNLSEVGRDVNDTASFFEARDREKAILSRIQARFKEMGGFTPELSRKIGWIPKGENA